MHLGIYLLLPFWAGYTKRLGVIQGNKSNKEKKINKKTTSVFLISKSTLNLLCTLQEERVSKKIISFPR